MQTESTKEQLMMLAVVLLVAALVGVVNWANGEKLAHSGPGAMEIDTQGHVWIDVDHHVYVLDDHGKTLFDFDPEEKGIARPIVTISKFQNHEMLIGSRGNGEIYRLTPKGALIGRLEGGDKAARRPFGVFYLDYIPGRDEIVLTDPSNHRILVLDSDGNILHTAGSPGNQPGIFRFPNGVIHDSEGRILVVDSNNYKVKILNPDLSELGAWSPVDRSTKFHFPVFIDRDGKGKSYVTIHDNQLYYAELVRLSETGEREHTYILSDPIIPAAIQVKSNGSILLVDEESYSVFEIGNTGLAVARFGDDVFKSVLEKSRAARKIFSTLVMTTQIVLGVLLFVLIGVLLKKRRREKKEGEAVALPMEEEVRGLAHIWQSIKQAFLIGPVVGLPFYILFITLILITGTCYLDTYQWAALLVSIIIISIPAIILSAIFRYIYRKGIEKGKYHKLYRKHAIKILGRHRVVLAQTLVPGEKVVDIAIGMTNRLPVLVFLTSNRLIIATLTTFGARLRRIQALPLTSLRRIQFNRVRGILNYFRYACVPFWRASLSLSKNAGTYAIDFPDSYGMVELAKKAKKLAVQDKGTPATGVKDLACPDCIQVGTSATKSFLASLLYPGLGQFYNQELYRGLVFLIATTYLIISDGIQLFIAVVFRTAEVAPYNIVLYSILLATFWLLAMVSALVTTRRNRLGHIGLLPIGLLGGEQGVIQKTGFFDKLTETAFKKSKDGVEIYYPNGVLTKGRIISDANKRKSLFRYHKYMIKYMMPVAFLFGAVAGLGGAVLEFGILIVGVALLAYAIQRYLIRGLPVHSERLTMREVFMKTARAWPSYVLIFFIFIGVGNIAMGLSIPLMLKSPIEELVALIAIQTGMGAFVLAFSVYVLKLKRIEG